MPRSSDRSSVLCLLSIIGALFSGCGGTHPESEALTAASPALSTLREDHRPPLSLIRREGDPEAALGIAIAHDGGTNYNRGLAAVLEVELRRLGLQPKLQLVSRGLIATAPLTPSSLHRNSNLPDALQAGLLHAARTAQPSTTHSAIDSHSAIDPCDPLPLSTARVELGSNNVAFAVVGTERTTREFAEQYAVSDSWPSSSHEITSWPSSDQFVELRAPETNLSLSLRGGSGAELLGAWHQIVRPEFIGNRLAPHFPPRWSLLPPQVISYPQGHCLTVTFQAEKPASRKEAAAFAVAMRAGIEDAVRHAEPVELSALALTRETSRDAAGAAAWQALAPARPAGKRGWVTLLWSPESRQSLATPSPDLEREVEAAREQRSIRLTGHIERGQGQIWAALSSQCPVHYETRATAGQTELAMITASHAFVPHVTLEPWLGFGGPGLFAHMSSLGERPPEAVADALALGLLTAASSETAPALIHAQLRRTAETPLLDLAANLLTDGYPSRLLSRGTRLGLATSNAAQLDSAARAFLRTPLRLTVIASHDSKQVERIHTRLERLLSPFLDPNAQCPELTPRGLAGEYTLEVEASAPDAVLAYPLPISAIHLCRAVAFLLNRKDGFFERSLDPVGPNQATAACLGTQGGTAALLLLLGTVPEQTDALTHQVRGLMQRLSGGALGSGHAGLIARHFARPSSETPRDRLLQLIEQKPAAPSLEELRRFAHRYLSEEHLVVIRADKTLALQNSE